MLYKSLYDSRLPAEPRRRKATLTVPNDFLTVRPSIEELLDHIAQNFFNPRKSGGPFRKLGLEAFIQPEDARFAATFRLRSRAMCDVTSVAGLDARHATAMELSKARSGPCSRFRPGRGTEHNTM